MSNARRRLLALLAVASLALTGALAGGPAAFAGDDTDAAKEACEALKESAEDKDAGGEAKDACLAAIEESETEKPEEPRED
jgi:hypothetical protein